jgi:hypothetical protein
MYDKHQAVLASHPGTWSKWSPVTARLKLAPQLRQLCGHLLRAGAARQDRYLGLRLRELRSMFSETLNICFVSQGEKTEYSDQVVRVRAMYVDQKLKHP